MSLSVSLGVSLSVSLSAHTTAVLQLAAATTRKVKHQHTRRTLAFVKACLAYAHVSVAAVQVSELPLPLQTACRAHLQHHCD